MSKLDLKLRQSLQRNIKRDTKGIKSPYKFVYLVCSYTVVFIYLMLKGILFGFVKTLGDRTKERGFLDEFFKNKSKGQAVITSRQDYFKQISGLMLLRLTCRLDAFSVVTSLSFIYIVYQITYI